MHLDLTNNHLATISSTLQKISDQGIKIQDSSQATIIGAAIGAIATLLAAYFAVRAAFKQIARQFEHKVVYEGWKDLQQKLFDFSNALMDYDSQIQWLTYFIDSQDNPLINGGNKPKHRLEKWDEITDNYQKLQSAYIAFLKSFENHEVIFLPLKKMETEFQAEFRKRTEDSVQNFMNKLFPEMYGSTITSTNEELKTMIDNYWLQLTEISAFLDDFRIELQNLTVGKILNKKVPKRVMEKGKGYKILTRKGFITEK
ncbi:MAG: hypothetical protein Q7R49_01215 [Candidatus Daviesbacteria bacterium]|nr:hypothetical protein [Candidatus Daviesbacteria bacterium]